MITKRIFSLVSLFIISSCDTPIIPDWNSIPSLEYNFGEGPKKADNNSCNTSMQLNVQKLNWEKAKRIQIFKRKSGISPNKIKLNTKTPYILKIYNSTKDIWNFKVDDFLEKVRIAKIIYDGKTLDFFCIEAIRVGKLKWAEIHLVPLQTGNFNFSDDDSFSFKKLFLKQKLLSIGQIIVSNTNPTKDTKSEQKESKIISETLPIKSTTETRGQEFQVQLSATRSSKLASEEWERLKSRHLDLLGRLSITIKKVDLGTKRGVFYRLRAGSFSNESKARELCKALAKRKVDCLLIKPKN